MDDRILGNGFQTRKSNGSASGKNAVADEHWFSAASQALYSHKPGTVLFLVTGLGDERLCQRYAAGHVRPPAYFLRALLRSGDGWQWLSATMDGCEQSWWLGVQDAMKLKRAIDNR